MMFTDKAQQLPRLVDYAKRLGAARDRGYLLAREVERSRAVLDVLSQDPATDAELLECANQALEALNESLVRLCGLTDDAATNAEALSSLPLKFFSNDN